MESIKIMVEEHEIIKRMLKVLRKVSYELMVLGDYDLDDYPIVIDFIRVYADKHHHGKEEDILFDTMNKEIERLAKSGAITGMYIEHDLGRLYMKNLELGLEDFKAGNDESRLDIIANSIAYTDLLERHIDKENSAMYKFAENMLNQEAKNFIEEKCKDIEDKATKEGLQEKYISILENLENKYLQAGE